MSNKPERISTICRQHDKLKQFSDRVHQLNQLNLILQNALPLQFANHCQLANVSNDTIIIHTDNAAYASLLRFQAPVLCKTLSSHLNQPVLKLEVKVRPIHNTKATTTQRHAGLSTSTASKTGPAKTGSPTAI